MDGKLLKNLRLWAGYSQHELAKASGVTQSNISRAEGGIRELHPDEVVLLSKALNQPKPEKPRAPYVRKPHPTSKGLILSVGDTNPWAGR